MDIQVNYISVFVAAIVSMAAGFLWYSPVLFAKPWMKLMGFTADGLKKMQKEMSMMYGLSFVLSLLTAYVLFHIMTLSINFFHYSKISTGLISAFWIWLGFVMPVQVTGVIFGQKGVGKDQWSLLAINTGYQLAALLLMGATIGVLM